VKWNGRERTGWDRNGRERNGWERKAVVLKNQKWKGK
jgi:hypothetical protein